MRKKLLICNNDPGIGMIVKQYFNATDYTVWNCTMYPNDVKAHLDKRIYDVVVFFAGDNKHDVAFTVRKLKEGHPGTDIIVVMLYSWDHFEDNYYDEGASLCVWFRDTSASLLAGFIRLMLFRRDYTDPDPYVSTFLVGHGFTGFKKGFYYFCTAFSMCLKEPERLNHVIKQVYTETAVRCNAPNYSSVERALRYYIESVLNSPELDRALKMRFPKIPPPKKFISGLCDFYNECNY